MEKVESAEKQEDQLIKNFENKNGPKIHHYAAIVLVLAVLLGFGIGYISSKGKTVTQVSNSPSSAGEVTKGSIYGSNDLATFKDEATGTLQKGGIEGEGQFHLVRPGGDSQNVYLTSSLVDLNLFVGKKIKVNGQTQTAKKAGWLMDVGRVEVLE